MKTHWSLPGRAGFAPLLVTLAVSVAASNAHATLINFEGYADSTVLNTQYQAAGVTFANADIVKAQYSLDEQDFPPHSGANVAIDYGGPMVIAFSTPVAVFSGYFTYTEPLLIKAYDIYGNPIAALTATSLFDTNTVSSFNAGQGNNPNELITLGNNRTGFKYVSIAGDPNGFSFAVDDISATAPEPGTVVLFAGAALSLLAIRHRSRLRGLRGYSVLAVGLLVWSWGAQAQTITATVDQPVIQPNTATNVTITANFSAAPIPTGVLLQQVNSLGAITNPALGTLTMVNPTTFRITMPFTLANGSTLLQVSAGFRGQLIRVVSNPLAIFASTFAVSYTGNITIVKDQSGGALAIPNPVYALNPNTSNAVAYVAGNTMMATVTFVQNPVPAAPIPNVTVTGTITNGPMGPTKFTANNVTLPAAAVATVTGLVADAPLQANLVQYFSAANPMTVQWSYSAGGPKTNIGTSSNPLYVTLAQPLNANVYLTDLKFAVSNPGAATPAQALANTWSLFTANPGPANISTWDGRNLFYYPTNTGFSGCATSERSLITSATGAGQCGSFAYLLAGALNANGIGVNGGTADAKVVVVPKYNITPPPMGVTADQAFLVKNWTYALAGTSGDANYPFKLIFNPGAGGIDMVPAQPGGVYGDLTSNAGIAGQNSPTPSEKAFARHFIIKPDAPLNTLYYDPSYGVTYTNANDFEVKAVAGYIEADSAIMVMIPDNVYFDREAVNGAGAQLKNIEFSR